MSIKDFYYCNTTLLSCAGISMLSIVEHYLLFLEVHYICFTSYDPAMPKDKGVNMYTKENQVAVNCDENENKDAVEGIKHPLQNNWSFWMFTNNKSTWEENLVKLTTFDTVEDYWCLYHHMKKPNELQLGQDYAIFKNDIRPMWEDSANKSGGRWLITFGGRRNADLDAVWLYVVLLLIGENFEHSNVICGAVVNVRVKSKIGIWISDSRNKKIILEIGKKLKGVIPHGSINFHAHNCLENMYTI